MRFLFYFRLSSYLLIGCGFLALLLTEFFGTVAGLLFGAILAGGWLVDNNKMDLRVSDRIWNILVLPAALLCGADILFVRRYPVVGIVSFLIFLQITKLFHKKENKDYLFLYVISFIQLLTVAVITTDVVFSIPFILYTILATWTLIIFYLKCEIETHYSKDAGGRVPEGFLPHPAPREGISPAGPEQCFKMARVERALNPYFFLSTSALTLVMFAMILVIFFLVPRISVGYFFRENERVQQISGFSEEVKLGSFGNIRTDHTPILRIEVPDISTRLPGFIRWRGISLDYYDGRNWKVSRKQERKVPGKLEVTFDGKPLYFFNMGVSRPSSVLVPKERLLRQEVEVSPVNSNVIFGAYQIQGVSGVFTPLTLDELSEAIRSDLPSYRGRRYTVYSEITGPSEEELRQAPTGYDEVPDLQEMYTQLPPISREIKKLARSITEKYPAPYDKAKALERYLQDNFEYSLNVQRDEGIPPLEDFFFKHQAGHCEYFATGMVVLLRTLGIPARMVNGFQQGQWNEFGKYVIVRKSDAHSWVEVFFPSYGWVAFDPTPPAAFSEEYAPVIDRIPVVSTVNRYLDFIRMRWDRYIVQYNLMDQIQLALSLRSQVLYVRDRVTQYLEGLRPDLSRVSSLKSLFTRENLVYLSALGLGLAALIRVLFRSREDAKLKELFPHSPPSSRHLKVVKLYLKMLRILAKKGIHKESYQTPREFVLQLTERQVPHIQEIHEITRLYYRARYSAMEVSLEEMRKTERLLEVVNSK